MAQLAIKGHATRGREVIELLEMLGGKNIYNYYGTFNECYIIDNGNISTCYTRVAQIDGFVIITLEEFIEKFPYKVGDNAQYKGATSCDSIFVIEKMQWVDSDIEYTIRNLWNINYRTTVKAEDLQPYKEETMERKYNVEEYLKVWEETEKGLEVVVNDKFEIKEDNGKFYIIKKQPQYPKTYEECCKVLDYCGDYFLTTYDNNEKPSAISNILNSVNFLTKLLICRNAYWKIAGEQMGLGKPWEPDWKDCTKPKYTIHLHSDGHIFWQDVSHTEYRWLSFPIAEMRDAFYENFKKEIEECKELL